MTFLQTMTHPYLHPNRLISSIGYAFLFIEGAAFLALFGVFVVIHSSVNQLQTIAVILGL